MNKVGDDAVQTAGRIFDRYDIDGDGVLSQDELGTHLEKDTGSSRGHGSSSGHGMSFREAVLAVMGKNKHEFSSNSNSNGNPMLSVDTGGEDGQSSTPYVEMS